MMLRSGHCAAFFFAAVLANSLTFAFLLDKGNGPNIIFIVADDLGFSDVGFRNGDIISPNLDKLARDGVLLNQSYVQPTCSPTRSAILTGRYPHKLGIQRPIGVDQSQCLPLNETLLPKRLKSLGYKTHAIGKWHLGYCNWNCVPTRRGFDTFYGIYAGAGNKYSHRLRSRSKAYAGFDFRDNEEAVKTGINGKYSEHLYGNRAVDVIQNHDTTNPMFMWLSFQNVHSPVQVPDKYIKMYPGMDNKTAAYYGMVTIMDEYIGKIISTLKKKQMYDNSLLIFTTDNGGDMTYGANNWPLRGEKGNIFEGGTRGVTLIDSPLLQKRGYVNKGIFHAIDWTPTLLHFAERVSQTDSYLDGVDQFEMLNRGAASKRTEFIYQLSTTSAIRVGDYKLIRGQPEQYTGYSEKPATVKSKSTRQVTRQGGIRGLSQNDGNSSRQPGKANKTNNNILLFNIKDDPTELKDLSKTLPQVANSLKEKLRFARMYSFVQQVSPTDEKSNPANFDNFWSPGWC